MEQRRFRRATHRRTALRQGSQWRVVQPRAQLRDRRHRLHHAGKRSGRTRCAEPRAGHVFARMRLQRAARTAARRPTGDDAALPAFLPALRDARLRHRLPHGGELQARRGRHRPRRRGQVHRLQAVLVGLPVRGARVFAGRGRDEEMHAVHRPHLQREPARSRTRTRLRAGVPDAGAPLRRPGRSRIEGVEAGRRTRRCRPDAGTGLRARQPLPAATTAPRRQRSSEDPARRKRNARREFAADGVALARPRVVASKHAMPRFDISPRHRPRRAPGRCESFRARVPAVRACGPRACATQARRA